MGEDRSGESGRNFSAVKPRGDRCIFKGNTNACLPHLFQLFAIKQRTLRANYFNQTKKPLRALNLKLIGTDARDIEGQ